MEKETKKKLIVETIAKLENNKNQTTDRAMLERIEFEIAYLRTEIQKIN